MIPISTAIWLGVAGGMGAALTVIGLLFLVGHIASAGDEREWRRQYGD